MRIVQVLKRNHSGSKHCSFKPDSSELETVFQLVLCRRQERRTCETITEWCGQHQPPRDEDSQAGRQRGLDHEGITDCFLRW